MQPRSVQSPGLGIAVITAGSVMPPCIAADSSRRVLNETVCMARDAQLDSRVTQRLQPHNGGIASGTL